MEKTKTSAIDSSIPIRLEETTAPGVFLDQFGTLYSLEMDMHTGHRFLKKHQTEFA